MGEQLTQDERIARLRLIRTPHVGPKTYLTLLNMVGTAEEALLQVGELSRRGGRKEPIQPCGLEAAQAELAAISDAGAQLVLLGEAAYPELLQHIPDPPPALIIKGDATLLLRESVAMVGARNSSMNAKNLAKHIAKGLADAGYAVISGLARGIDAEVHSGALEGGTIAVIGNGIDKIYPRENAKLYEQIAEQGVIVTECPVGTEPRAELFPRRNRIISGISLGTVVVEATARSGSLITARLAGEQGREVMAIPGSPADPRAEGPNKLLKDGATLVGSTEDIIEAVRGAKVQEHMQFEEEMALFNEEVEYAPADELDESTRDNLTDQLSNVPVEVDALITETGTSAAQVMAMLLELELAGRLIRHPGGKVSLS